MVTGSGLGRSMVAFGPCTNTMLYSADKLVKSAEGLIHAINPCFNDNLLYFEAIPRFKGEHTQLSGHPIW
jgi:hypothetical protein